MRGKRLPGAGNTALRRRIVRAENDIIPRLLRVHSATDAPLHGARQPPLHTARSASEIGAQLSLPPDHAAASWLTTSWTVPDLTGPLPNESDQWAMPPLPSPGAARWRGHAIQSATPAPQPPLFHAEATTATTPWAGSKRSFASMDVREPAGDGCPDLPATLHPGLPPFMERHTMYRRTTPTNVFYQSDADPDAVYTTSVARAESPSTDFASFAFTPSEDSFERGVSISTDFTRVASEEDRAFVRLLSISANATHPGFFVGGAGAKASHPCSGCDFSRPSQAGGGGEARRSFAAARAASASGCPDFARLSSAEDRHYTFASDVAYFPGSEDWPPPA